VSVVAVLLHDGFYSCGTGAGVSNRRFLEVLATARALRASPGECARLHAAGRRLISGRYDYERNVAEFMRAATQADRTRESCASILAIAHQESGPTGSGRRRSRFSKRVSSLRNMSSMVPVGPLRCLETMTSAMPGFSDFSRL
jgi:hypothetical protein